tara:strand:+ start:266 stop:1219 length:954 start_codon:yes stop_codon:yes gene_type:complete
MTYLPKSKIQISDTSGGEFVFKNSRKPYKGTYMATSTGKYYQGSDNYNLKTELIKVEPVPLNFKRTKTNIKYNILQPSKFKFLKKIKSIALIKPQPTEKDYEKFKFIRYFAKKINSALSYIEVDKEIYDSIKGKKPEYDHNLYEVGKIEWALSGNTQTINKNTLTKLEEEHPGISTMFTLLNEYKSGKSLPIESDPYYNPPNVDEDTEPISPEDLIKKKNFTRHKIKGRKYIDQTPIPLNLPPTYGFPYPNEKILSENQKCKTCFFSQAKGHHCGYWSAPVKSNYWCKTYAPLDIEIIKSIDSKGVVKETISRKGGY